jgi:O-antigen/teichoic acid export membrane protein
MSRFKRFANSLLSGYALVLANIVYTVASVPLALHYLSKEQFGLWFLVVQVCNFNQIMIDLGMSSAVARVLIDHKDDRASTRYGAVIQTGFLILLVQGILIAVIGGLISYWLPQWMDVPAVYWREFRLLVIWQCVMLAVSFALRISTFVLQAHQRFDVANYAQLSGFVAGLAALWLAFEAGLGMFSLLASGAVSIVWVNVICLWQAYRLRFFPSPGLWGRPDRATFRELFFYGTDLFMVAIGLQLITASQAIIITRTLGLEATAIWNIATKLFMLSQQLVYRLLDFSTATFSEMMVRSEKARLQMRFRDVLVLTGSASAAIGLTMAVCNESFLIIWTKNRIAWAVENDLLMAGSLVVYAITRCHIGLACMTKTVGRMKYIYFAEGLVFVSFGLLAAPHWGLTSVIAGGIISNLLLSGVYGFKRSAEFFGIRFRELGFIWLRQPLLVFGSMLPVAIMLWLATRSVPALPRLLICGTLMGGSSAACLWRLGLPESLRTEVVGKLNRLRSRWAGTS